jgi:hypothetical protein
MENLMNNYFPFDVKFVNGALYGSPEQMYQIVADFSKPELAAYKSLFRKYAAAGGDDSSPVEVAFLIIEHNTDDLLDYMDFDEEGDLLKMHVSNESALEEFASVVCPIYRDLTELESYVQSTTGLK